MFAAVIPARYASTRLPGKPLLDIAGIPMVVHVAMRAREAGADEVWVATDHAGIYETVKKHGFDACMTKESHASGTDRIAEVAALLNWPDEKLIVNVQGDEPLISPELISGVAAKLEEDGQIDMATACHPIEAIAEMQNPNIVKVVLDKKERALYFSRATIPFARDFFGENVFPEGLPAYRHVGLYAYRAGLLKTYAALSPAPIEKFEALEQLRLLWHGYRIGVKVTPTASAPGVDTASDLEYIRKKLCD